MRMGSQSASTVVLLGAGATRGSYTGIGASKIRPPLNVDFFDVARKFVGTSDGRSYRGPFSRLERFIDKEMRITATEPHTMEQVFNVLFMSKDMPGVFSRGGRPRDIGYRREIADFFRVVVGLLRYVQDNPRHPLGIDHHGRLAGALEPGDTLISLNYDTLVDNALVSAGWDPRVGYGFRAANKVTFSGGLSSDRSLKNVLLLKPHGSLNWFAKGSISTFEEVLTKRPPSKILISPSPRAYNITRERLVRFFIPPLYAKFFANSFWRNLWQESFKRIREANVLVIVGCSLIETDFHLRAIIGRAFASRSRKFAQIILVGPSVDVRRRLKKFLRGRSQSGFTSFQTFTDFVNRSL